MGKTDRAGLSIASIIDLCSSDGDGKGSDGSGSDEDVNGEPNWEKLMAEAN